MTMLARLACFYVIAFHVWNFEGHNAILNSIAINGDGVLVSGADNGTMNFWDWRTGYNFQRHQTVVQPGSIDSEVSFD